MTVGELISSLNREPNKEKEVRVTDTQGNFNVEVFTIESDEEDVFIVIFEPSL